MHPIEHPETIMLIHDEMIRREIARGKRERTGRDDIPGPHDRNRPGQLRNTISRGLIALARRIAPDEVAETGLPAGARH